MLTPFIANAADATDLTDWGPLATALGAPMHQSGVYMHEGPGIESGIWQCTSGLSRWEFATNEFIHVLWGAMTVTHDGEDPVEVSAGSTVLFAKGWSGTWEITETIRKVFVVF